MESIRVTAKTVQEAITEALIQLGTSSDNMEYTVIDEGSKGFFGIGGRKAVIEAKKKFTDEDLMKEVFGTADEKKEKPKKEFRKEPKKELKKEPKKEIKEGKKEQPAAAEEKRNVSKEKSSENPRESRKENRRESGRDSGKAAEIALESGTESRESAAVRREAEDSAASSVAAPERRKSIADAAGEKASANEEIYGTARREKPRNSDREAGGEGRGYRRNGRKEYRRQAPEEVAAVAEQPEKTEEAAREPRVPADPEEAKRRAEKFLRDVFGAMEMGVEIRMEFEDDTLSVELTGEDMGLLIGKRGQTLDSLQYLTSLVVNKGKAAYVRVKLDTEDYRSRRKATLENLAKNIAMKVKKTRRPVFLEPMNPYERRIIHSALQNDPYVTTHSEGDEPNRKVVVTPKKRNDGRPSGRDYRDRSYRERSYGARSYAEKREFESREAELKDTEVKEPEVREAAAVPAEPEE